jgi:hypothetical protein
MRQPPGFVKLDSDGQPFVLKLKKSLYGLHQSPRLWQHKLIGIFKELGYLQCAASECLLRHPSTGVIVVVFVDDIQFTGSGDQALLDAAFEQVAQQVDIKDLGQVRRFVGLNYSYGSDGSITLDQLHYINTLLARFGMLDAHGVRTPMVCGGDGGSARESPLLDAAELAEYQRLVGGLGWVATCTKPDTSYTVSQLQQRNTVARRSDWEAALRALRYLKEHPDGITYSSSGGAPQLIGYADASFAADKDTRRSHTGFVFLLAGGAVAWRSKRQQCVTLSTAEAEYVALCSAAKDAIPLLRALRFLGVQQRTVELLEDNTAAARLAADPAASQRTKHVDVQFHYVREQVRRGRITVVAVRTQEQHADVLTKALGVELHQFHTAALLGSA